MRKAIISYVALLTALCIFLSFAGCAATTGDAAETSGAYTVDSEQAAGGTEERTLETEYYTSELTSYAVTVDVPGNPYDMDYQQEVNDEIAAQLEAGGYTLESPFACLNPYGTSQLAMLIAFDDVEGYASYTIKSPYSEEQDTKTDSEITSSYRLEVFGLYPGVTNEIAVDIYGADGGLLKEAAYSIEVPSVELELNEVTDNDGNAVELPDINNPLRITAVTKEEGVSDGLFVMTGTVSSYFNYKYIFFYDNDANLRGVIDTDYRADNVIEMEDGIVFTYDETTIVYATLLGETICMYTLDGYEMHHDFAVDDQNRAFILATKLDSGNVEDWLLVVDLSTGEVLNAFDFKELFEAEDWYYELNMGDWTHLNSVEYVAQKGGNLIISSRELSMIFSLTEADTYEYQLEYIINEGTTAGELGLEEYNLSVVGDYTYNLGQHSVRLAAAEDENHYQLVFFNNYSEINNEYGSDDYPEADRLDYSGMDGVDGQSYITLLNIDTENMTLEVEHTAELEWSMYRGSARAYQGNYIASSTGTGQLVELDSDFNVVLEFALISSGVYVCDKLGVYDEGEG